jgi:hypothetical protein
MVSMLLLRSQHSAGLRWLRIPAWGGPKTNGARKIAAQGAGNLRGRLRLAM